MRRVAVSGASRWLSCQPASRLLSHPHTFRNSLGPNLSGTHESCASRLKPSRDTSSRYQTTSRSFASRLLRRSYRVPSLPPLLSTTSCHTRPSALTFLPLTPGSVVNELCARDGSRQAQHDSHHRHRGLRSRRFGLRFLSYLQMLPTSQVRAIAAHSALGTPQGEGITLPPTSSHLPQ